MLARIFLSCPRAFSGSFAKYFRTSSRDCAASFRIAADIASWLNFDRLPPPASPLEPPLSNQECSQSTRRLDVLIARQRWLLKDVAGVDPRLQTISFQASKPVHHRHARPLQCLRIERRFHFHEPVRPDVP